MGKFNCKICGKEFDRIGNGVYCAGPHYRPCPVCGKPVEFSKPSEPYKCCSKECSSKLRKATMISRFAPRKCKECGKEFIPQASTQVYCSGPHVTHCKYCDVEIPYTCSPVEKPTVCSKECQEASKKQHLLEKYGVDNVSRIPQIKQKISEIKRLGHSDIELGSDTAPSQEKVKICPECGKTFTSATKKYCDGPHYRNCEVCGTLFEINVLQPRRCCSKECTVKLQHQSISKIERYCKLCGKRFRPKGSMQQYCEDDHYVNCKICGKPVKVINNYITDVTCSKECSEELRKRTCMKLYGVPVSSQADSVRKQLHERALANNESRKQSIQNTYGMGYTNIAQVPEIRQKISDTVRSIECRTKTQTTNISKYGVPYAMQNKELRSKQSRNSRKPSSLEIRLENILSEYNIKHVPHMVVADSGCLHEFDMYLPDYKILVDCDGVYWHAYISDPDGMHSREEGDEIRLSLVPHDHIFYLIVESGFERGLKGLIDIIKSIDSNTFDYDTELFKWCRSTGFPYYHYEESRLRNEWSRLQSYNIERYNEHCKIGISLINQYHRSLYDVRVNNKPSPREAWEDDNMLKTVIANRLIYQNDVNPSKVLQGFNISKIAPKASVFNPILARYICEKYLKNFIDIVDPFSGFSGRLLGCCSTSKHYTGFDINTQHVEESNQIIQFLGLDNQAKVVVQDLVTSPGGTYDALFTCPPYMSKEIYGQESEIHSCDEWIDLCINKFNCSRYIFVVDSTEKYKDYIIEELESKSHFRHNSEYIICIDKL